MVRRQVRGDAGGGADHTGRCDHRVPDHDALVGAVLQRRELRAGRGSLDREVLNPGGIARFDMTTHVYTTISNSLSGQPGVIVAGPDLNMWSTDSGAAPGFARVGTGVCDDSLEGCNLQRVNLQNIVLVGADLQDDQPAAGATPERPADRSEPAGREPATRRTLGNAQLAVRASGGRSPAGCRPVRCEPDRGRPHRRSPARRDADRRRVVEHHLPGRNEQQQRRRDLREQRITMSSGKASLLRLARLPASSRDGFRRVRLLRAISSERCSP